jgi:hypothetical protein
MGNHVAIAAGRGATKEKEDEKNEEDEEGGSEVR